MLGEREGMRNGQGIVKGVWAITDILFNLKISSIFRFIDISITVIEQAI